MEYFDNTYVHCACYAEILHVSRDKETGEVYLAAYTPSGVGKIAWKWRLKHIWRIITKGYPWQDNIILTPKDAKEFGEWLLKTHGVENTPIEKESV